MPETGAGKQAHAATTMAAASRRIRCKRGHRPAIGPADRRGGGNGNKTSPGQEDFDYFHLLES
jgi:hypothetical protein